MKRALVIGASGQDGSYACDILLERGYEVHGIYRRTSIDNLQRIVHIKDRIALHKGDLADWGSIDHVIQNVLPHEIYNMADQDHVDWSKHVPSYNSDITYGAVVRLLESVRSIGHTRSNCRVFQPISSTVFGSTNALVDENSPLAPASPYAVSKAAAWLACKHYRREYGVKVSCGIFWNHDSPRRGADYLMQKMVRHARKTRVLINDPQFLDTPPKLSLYSTNSRVDIGYAKEYVEAATLMFQLDESIDLIIGTGRNYRIIDMAQQVYKAAGLRYSDCVEEKELRETLEPRPSGIALERTRNLLNWNPKYDALILGPAMVKGEVT